MPDWSYTLIALIFVIMATVYLGRVESGYYIHSEPQTQSQKMNREERRRKGVRTNTKKKKNY